MFFQDSKRPGELLGWRRTHTRQLAVLSLLRVSPGPTPGLRIGILRRWGGFSSDFEGSPGESLSGFAAQPTKLPGGTGGFAIQMWALGPGCEAISDLDGGSSREAGSAPTLRQAKEAWEGCQGQICIWEPPSQT